MQNAENTGNSIKRQEILAFIYIYLFDPACQMLSLKIPLSPLYIFFFFFQFYTDMKNLAREQVSSKQLPHVEFNHMILFTSFTMPSHFLILFAFPLWKFID